MKVLVSPWWSEEGVEDLRKSFPKVQIVTARQPEEIAKEIADAEIVFGWVTRDGFLTGRNLRWVQSFGAGVEWMARVPELLDSDVTVTNTRGAHAQTIAEHTFAMLLSLTRGLHTLMESQKAHMWAPTRIGQVISLSGLTLGVVGMGNIGRQIAKRGAAFDMNVIGIDAMDVARPDYVQEIWKLDRLDDLMKMADVVVVAVPLTTETRGLFHAARLAQMKPTSYLVAISRGGIVDQDALASLLREGKIAGACLDVTDPEPLPEDSPLWDTPNLIVTPHCSGVSRQTTEGIWNIFKENLQLYLAGKQIDNVVDKRRGF